MASKYATIKTTTPNEPWKGSVSVDNVRTYPKKSKKRRK